MKNFIIILLFFTIFLTLSACQRGNSLRGDHIITIPGYSLDQASTGPKTKIKIKTHHSNDDNYFG